MELSATDRYRAYLYAYPHKTAYRRLDAPVPLDEAWQAEDRRALFLYVHVPFCEMRCGFCNLFTQAQPPSERIGTWLATLARQAAVTRRSLGADTGFARLAIGGGTPTMLDPGQLDRLLDIARSMGADAHEVPASVETSPRTATPARLQVLHDHGVDRISIGVESLDRSELRVLGRPQQGAVVDAALSAIRATGFPTLNIDLIYGTPGQTRRSWATTLDAVIRWAPEELYLYPLYRRPLTGMGTGDTDDRPQRYAEAVDRLTAAGYRQVSMRQFQRAERFDDPAAPSYDCQDDGMVGLGIGARSYTTSLHYAHEYAVGRPAVAELIGAYLGTPDEALARVDHGFRLDDDEQRRRWVIKSLLRRPGLDVERYRDRFATLPLDDLTVLGEAIERGWLIDTGDRIVPTDEGLAWSDALGPAIMSDRVRSLMAGYEPR
jgi:coproporphyrinogen III oxidase-like Fe-S oxidoreductase